MNMIGGKGRHKNVFRMCFKKKDIERIGVGKESDEGKVRQIAEVALHCPSDQSK